MISYEAAAKADKDTLFRWLRFAVKRDPGEKRILEQCGGSKEGILAALVWLGAIDGGKQGGW